MISCSVADLRVRGSGLGGGERGGLWFLGFWFGVGVGVGVRVEGLGFTVSGLRGKGEKVLKF